MQSTTCSNCGQPLPAGAAFCASCGAAQQPAPHPLLSSAETMRAGAPPAGAGYAPTQLQPPPAPAAPSQSIPSGPDAYASQYTPSPPAPPPYPVCRVVWPQWRVSFCAWSTRANDAAPAYVRAGAAASWRAWWWGCSLGATAEETQRRQGCARLSDRARAGGGCAGWWRLSAGESADI